MEITLVIIITLSIIFTGGVVMIRKTKVVTHAISYLILRIGIFLISLSISNEMLVLVSLCILFNIICSVLMLGVFENEMSRIYKEHEVTPLNNRTD